MKNSILRTLTLAIALPLGSAAIFAQAKPAATPAPAAQAAPKAAKKPVTPAASDADIAAAKAAGKVWVNTGSDTKTYHKAESRWYGKTKQGQFMTEADAKKAGYHAAKSEGATGKAQAPTKKK